MGLQLGVQRRWQLLGGVCVALALAVVIGFAPIVRSVAQSRAAARGLELEIGSVRPGIFAVRLQDVTVRLRGVAEVEAKLERLRVGVTPLLRPSSVSVQGGEVSVRGTLDTLRAKLREWRAGHRGSAEGAGGDAGGSGLELYAEGINATWSGVDGTSAQQRIEGAYFERTAEYERAGFARARLEYAGASLTASAVSSEFSKGPEGVSIRSVEVDQVVGRLELDSDTSANGSVTANAAPADPSGEPFDDEETLAGDSDAASVPRASLVRWLAPLAQQAWERRRAQLGELRALASRALAEDANIDVLRLQLEIARGGSVLNVGPAPLEVTRRASIVSATLAPRAAKDGKQLAVTGRLPLNDAPIEMSFDGGPISLRALGVHEGDFGLLGVDDTALTVATKLVLSPAGALSISASGQLDRLTLHQPALAPEPLTDMNLAWGGELRLDMSKRELEITRGMLGLDRVRIEVDAKLHAADADLGLELSVRIPRMACEDALLAAPPALLPQLQGVRLGGTFALDSHVEFDTGAPKETDVTWELDNDCKVLETPEDIDPRRFREPFQHTVLGADGHVVELSTGPTTEHWVPLSDITPNMETALIVCEDSRFFTHNGFDNKAIRSSIIDNLKAGHFVRGASTLTMQLAKNLYLSREKTLSRKFQEAAFTLLLEQRLSKEDILELYLNVVEFGPGIYGIRNAAAHYFDSHPGELSLAQAMFLASVLPRPKAKHFAEDGTLRPRRAQHLQHLMRIARKINRISDDELEAGLSEQIVFGKPHPKVESDFLFGTPLYQLSDG